MRDIGTRIKIARMRKGISQKKLAEKISRSETAISSYELNTQTPPLDILISIAEVLDVSLDYLAGFDPEQTYSAAGLTPEQKEVVDLIFAEFCKPTNTGGTLSPQQVEIIQKMILLFSGQK